MELPRLSLKRSLLLSAAITVSLFSNNVLAQNSQPTSVTTSRQTTSSSSARTTAQTSPNQNTRSSSSSVTPPSLPAIGTTASTSNGPAPTLPTLTGTADTRIPEYPAPTIPPTNNAPFMNHSTLPDGTVFICVGAILGAFGLAIVVWRGIVACLLHRSVERATLAQHAANDKSFPAPPSQFYKFLERDPTPPHGAAAAAAVGKIHRKSHRGPTPSATASQTNLFFSPTAGPGGSTGIASANNRDSRFLPSGFYASASPMPGGGHAAGNSISLSTLRPSSRGNTVPSPPDSPSVGPMRNYSGSSVNLNRPPSGNGRAPSAFLDDLLDDPATQGRGQYLPAGGAYRGPDGQFYGGHQSPPGGRY
ncbi:hypothetical protein OQA88_4701 [Cercophora sp. LCS_1]